MKYPNEESFTAYLYDANGLLRMSWDGAHTPQVDLGHLPSGIYVLKVLAASGIATRKIILD
ncbi:MAG: T9SS type A sorting domain-containing protein [Cytophagales bacterium]|nr:T9SS type A sorting domain-containing protein [Cytophagales bacterium]